MGKKKITALILSMVMAFTPAIPAAAKDSVPETDIYQYSAEKSMAANDAQDTSNVKPSQKTSKNIEGWKIIDGHRCYLNSKGKKVTGLQKIGKYRYYFNSKGILITNKKYYKINGRYYKINSKGVVTSFSEVENLAAARLDKCGGNLRKAFNWSASLMYTGYVPVKKKTPEYYGIYGFKTGSGDCYVMASTFYWMAKIAGYDAHYVKGYFQKSNHQKGAHAWVEIDMKSGSKTKTYVYDPNFQKEYKLNGYKLTYGAKNTLKYVNYKRVN
ncbi:MAG: transglutaminase domain-containing protein [Clostridia bacterium]|nr:transglutaminase domain-containing protein [Clostridia bacterium]MDY5553819.1 transglutaminase domain-containing protein [Blautia sp.]